MGEVVAVVHAKGTSTRVPGKNLRLLGGRPLIAWAIQHALAARTVDRVVVDSESEEILQVGLRYGAEPLRRPLLLADNAATGDDLALWQAQALPDAGILVQAVPTSPFVRPQTIDAAVALVADGSADSVVGVRVEPHYLWRDGRPAYFRADGTIPNSFELPPVVRETTGLYVNRRTAVLACRRRISPRAAPIELSALEAVDIDTEDDFALAELVARGLQLTGDQAEEVHHALRHPIH